MSTVQQTSTIQVLTFKLGEELFAADVTKAREVLDFTSITRVPQTPPFMLGVLNLRGSVVPVIDMRLKFGLPAVEKTVHTCIIVLEVVVDGEPTVVGAVADSVQEVLELSPDQIGPPPRIGARLKTEFIRGMGQLDEEFMIILDIDRLFSSDELALVQNVSEQAEA